MEERGTWAWNQIRGANLGAGFSPHGHFLVPSAQSRGWRFIRFLEWALPLIRRQIRGEKTMNLLGKANGSIEETAAPIVPRAPEVITQSEETIDQKLARAEKTSRSDRKSVV